LFQVHIGRSVVFQLLVDYSKTRNVAMSII